MSESSVPQHNSRVCLDNEKWLRSMNTRGYAVYVLYGVWDVPLYVGYTGSLMSRLSKHANEKPWVRQETRRVETFAGLTYEQARNKEAELIQALQPRYNQAAAYTKYQLSRGKRIPPWARDGEWWRAPVEGNGYCEEHNEYIVERPVVRWTGRHDYPKHTWIGGVRCPVCREHRGVSNDSVISIMSNTEFADWLGSEIPPYEWERAENG